MTTSVPDLNLHLPSFDQPALPPPVLTSEQYGKWIDSVHEWMKQEGTLECLIANRSRPSEEIFVLP